jgi:hypothetical protein
VEKWLLIDFYKTLNKRLLISLTSTYLIGDHQLIVYLTSWLRPLSDDPSANAKGGRLPNKRPNTTTGQLCQRNIEPFSRHYFFHCAIKSAKAIINSFTSPASI